LLVGIFMLDWFKKFFSEPSTVIVLMTSGIVGLIIGIANGVIQKKHGGWPGFFGAIATGLAVAVIVGLGVQDYVKSEALRLAIVGVCSVISNDIWEGLQTFGRGLRSDPLGSIARLIDALRGKSSLPTPSTPPKAADEDEAAFRGPAH
jgi:hypothetical protein